MQKKNHDSLMELLGGANYRCIEVTGYMPHSVEVCGCLEEKPWKAYSLCQSGDYRREPIIVFLVENGEARASYFRNSYLGIKYATVADVFGDAPVRPHLQGELDTFASVWFQSLQEQGFFEEAKKLAQAEEAQEQEITR
jgi:hypothetical protein